MLVFIPRSLCALKRVAAKAEHARYGATQGIRIALAPGMFRAEATDGRRALVVQGLIPPEDPPWPGFKDLPDDAVEAIVHPTDLERACKVGDRMLQSRFGLFGLATMGGDVCLGLGSDIVTAPTVDGRFPDVLKVMPKKKPLFTFSVDPRMLAETLLAMAELLPDEARRVTCFYYGAGEPLGFCARNSDTGFMIDALVVPLMPPEEEKPAKEKKPAAEPEATEPAAADQQPEAEAPAPKEAPTESKKGRKARKDALKAKYQDAKERHPDMLLLFRAGDFYEAYFEDAETLAPVLGLTLTTRDKASMVGFPHHALQEHLQKLLQEGHRVAICDEVEEVPARAAVEKVASEEGGQP